jgi:hypothetical protein
MLATNRLLDRRGHNLAGLIAEVDRSELLRAYGTSAGQEDIFVIGSSRVRDGIVAAQAETLLQARLHDSLSQAAKHRAAVAPDSGSLMPGRRIFKLGLRGLRPALLCDILDSITRFRPPRGLLVIAVEERFFFVRGSPAIGQPRSGASDEVARQSRWPWRGLAGLAALGRYADPGFRSRQAQIWARSGDINPLSAWNEHPADLAFAKEAARTSAQVPEDTPWLLQPEQSHDMRAWRDLWSILDRLPCQVVFVRMPLNHTFLRLQGGEIERDFHRVVVSDIKARGYRFFDLACHPYPTEPSDYFHSNHLHATAAQRCTELLVRDVLAPLLLSAASQESVK